MNILSEYWKLLTTAVGSALLVWNQFEPGLSAILPTSWQHPLAVVVAILTAVATYAVPGPTKVVPPVNPV